MNPTSKTPRETEEFWEKGLRSQKELIFAEEPLEDLSTVETHQQDCFFRHHGEKVPTLSLNWFKVRSSSLDGAELASAISCDSACVWSRHYRTLRDCRLPAWGEKVSFRREFCEKPTSSKRRVQGTEALDKARSAFGVGQENRALQICSTRAGTPNLTFGQRAAGPREA